MPARVADASVVAAIAFGEPRAMEAARLLSDAALFAPNLLPYELASVAWKKVRERPRQRRLISLALARGRVRGDVETTEERSEQHEHRHDVHERRRATPRRGEIDLGELERLRDRGIDPVRQEP